MLNQKKRISKQSTYRYRSSFLSFLVLLVTLGELPGQKAFPRVRAEKKFLEQTTELDVVCFLREILNIVQINHYIFSQF